MNRNEYNEFRSIKADLNRFSKHGTLGHGTTLTIRTNASSEYKMKLHDLYMGFGFHPASVRVDRQHFDDLERIIYIYGLTWDYNGTERPWTDLYTTEEKTRFADALKDTTEEEPTITNEEKEEEPMTTTTETAIINTFNTALDAIITRPYANRSAWNRGVTAYAADLLSELKEAVDGGWFDADDLKSPRLVDRELLNGASDWNQYSWGGCSLIYDSQIAERLCNKTELKITRNGERNPNNREQWLDVQSRALYQAARLVSEFIVDAARYNFA